MRRTRKSIITSSLLALASHTAAQVGSVCPDTDVCFKLNIPESTASSGSGDIFFQISAPSSYEWVALGQGTRMSDSNIFVVYTSQDGNNVTISPRLASGHQMPQFNSDAQVTLLEGSGVSSGKMVANVRCSNCNSWSSGSADFKSDSGNWIYGYQSSGGPKNSNDQSATINQHNSEDSFQWSYANVKGGNSVNPLVNASPSGTGSGGSGGGTTSCVPRPQNGATATTSGASATSTDDSDDENESQTQWSRPAWATASPTKRPWGPPDDNDKRNAKRQEINYCDDSSSALTPISSGIQSRLDKMLIAHGVLAALAFVIFFPAGAIAIRLASFPGIVWLHAAFQVFAYLVYTAAFGLGVYIANEDDYLSEYHPIIGIVVFICLFFQPIFGFLHHSLFKKHQSRTIWSHAHLWLGRLVITLGIINGGLGFLLANGPTYGIIVYSVVAGIVWLVWLAATIIGERRRSKARDQPPKYAESPRDGDETALNDIPHPHDGHYAPK